MKRLLYILGLVLFYSCNSKPSKVTEPLLTDQPTTKTAIIDTALVFQYQTNFIDKNIINKSDRKVDLLFNGVEGYLGGRRNTNVSFYTECMACQSVQEFNGGLLFGKRLLITPEYIKYYKNNFDIPDRILLTR